jgi:CelD/BcsL family acetyltransferase involved in cellulose biosynthesis
MFRIELITRQTDFAALEIDWNSLLQRSEANNVFLTWEWLSNWWEVFGAGKELRIPVFYRNSELVGLVPLYVRKIRFARALPLREISFLGCGETVRSDYMDIISLPEYRDKCRDALLDHLIRDRSWDIATFKDLSDSSSLLSPRSKEELKVHEIETEGCHYIRMPDSYDNYLSGLDARMRRNIRNRRRNLNRDFSSVNFRILRKREELDIWMETFKSLHTRRMVTKGLSGKFSSDNYTRFHSLISKTFLKDGWLFAADLQLEGKIIACRYGFLYDNKIFDYQTGFDPDYNKNGVMQALLSYIIEYAATKKFREFDFLAGGDDYKRRFANSHRYVHTVRLVNNTTRGRIYSGLQKIRRLIKPQKRK